ncbi:restriction endonuclease subunit S [Kitasatospora sp. RG8]|nr:restriction endonuclease subunit S [Kitasatospora sp. RG8]
MDVVSLPTGQVDPRVEPYRSGILLAPDHVESATGRILKRETAAEQGAASGKYLVRPGDVVFSKIRPALRKVALADFSGVCSADMYPLRPKEDILGGFLATVLLGERFSAYVASISGRTGIPKVNRADLAGFFFVVPPLSEQRRIVEVVDAFSAQERAIEMSIQKLRSARQGALLAAMPSIEGGDLPRGWTRVPLKDVVPKAEYGISNALDQDPRGVPVLRMNNLSNGRPELSDLRYSSMPIPVELELRRGDVLFNRTNSIDHVGKSGMWRSEIPRAAFASYLVRINPDETRLIPEYLVEWLMHPLIRQRVKSISTVAVQQVNVNPTRLRELEIDMPVDLVEQRRIIDLLYSCDGQIQSEHAELKKIRMLKLGLVDDLLTGSS